MDGGKPGDGGGLKSRDGGGNPGVEGGRKLREGIEWKPEGVDCVVNPREVFGGLRPGEGGGLKNEEDDGGKELSAEGSRNEPKWNLPGS
jgi:hypothetical protein